MGVSSFGAVAGAYGSGGVNKCANATQDVAVWKSRIGKKAYPKAAAKMEAALVRQREYCSALEDVSSAQIGTDLPMDPSGSTGAGGGVLPDGISPWMLAAGAVAIGGLLWWSTS